MTSSHLPSSIRVGKRGGTAPFATTSSSVATAVTTMENKWLPILWLEAEVGLFRRIHLGSSWYTKNTDSMKTFRYINHVQLNQHHVRFSRLIYLCLTTHRHNKEQITWWVITQELAQETYCFRGSIRYVPVNCSEYSIRGPPSESMGGLNKSIYPSFSRILSEKAHSLRKCTIKSFELYSFKSHRLFQCLHTTLIPLERSFKVDLSTLLRAIFSYQMMNMYSWDNC